MRRQHRDSAEAFLAERTDVRFFGSRRVHAVLFHVLGQAVALSTGVRTLTALERLLAQVYLNVRFQRRTLLETFVAVCALVGTFVTVSFQVFR
jgi:hypothetical protein